MTWDLPVAVDVQGTAYAIRTDYRCILDICAAIADPELDGQEKSEAALDIFYPDYSSIPPEHLQDAVERCLWFIGGGDKAGGHRAPKLVDWEQDYPLLIAPVNRVLGREIRELKYLHWWTFLGAYQEIGDCTFAQVVRIRDMRARGKRLDKSDREWYQRNRQLVDFKNRYTEADEMTIREWG